MVRLAFGVLLLAASAPAAPSQANALKGLGFMIGTWTGGGELPGGERYTDEHTVEWIQERNFIKAEYVMKTGDKVTWTSTSIIGYDSVKKKLVAFVFGRTGAIARSEEVPSGRKDVWVFEDAVSSHGATVEGRVTQTRVDDDTFTSVVESKKDGAYATLGTYTYKRRK